MRIEGVTTALFAIFYGIMAEDAKFSIPLCDLEPSIQQIYPQSTLTSNCLQLCSAKYWEEQQILTVGYLPPSYCLVSGGKVYAAGNKTLDTLNLIDLKGLPSISHVEGLHPDANYIVMNNLGIKSLNKSLGMNRNGQSLSTIKLDLSNNSILSINGITFPSQMNTLILDKNSISDVSNLIAPSLSSLSLHSNHLHDIPSLSLHSLSTLSLENNLIKNINDTAWINVPNIQRLSIAKNQLTEFPTSLPTSLVSLNLQMNQLTHLNINSLPSSLEYICLNGNPIEIIHVNRIVFEQLKKLKNNSNECDSINKNLNPPSPSPCPISSTIDILWNIYPICILNDLNQIKNEKSNASIFVVSISLGFIIILLIAIYIQRKKNKIKLNWYDDKINYIINSNQIENDIRYDSIYFPFQIPPYLIERHHILARGGFGILYLGTLYPNSEYPIIIKPLTIVMKQILPEKLNDIYCIENFMEEIRINAKLYHKNIVKFIGFSYTILENINIITEYMENGDLFNYIKLNKNLNWNLIQNSNLNNISNEKEYNISKFTILCDIVEAIVYLHSMDPPIIHRDLKTKNVLLNDKGIGKLTDFGISRETSQDTMTAEIGTVAWIAPEVLKGIYYTEKADIYSLGVLISEMDTCEIPYSNLNEIYDEFQYTMDIYTAKTKIAMLVVSGELIPSFTKSCPLTILNIAKSCLNYNPNKRPNIYQIWNWLNEIKKNNILEN